MISRIGNTQPFTGNTHFFSRPNKCIGSDRFWIGLTSARPYISFDEIRFAIVTVVLLPCLSGRRTKQCRNYKAKRPWSRAHPRELVRALLKNWQRRERRSW